MIEHDEERPVMRIDTDLARASQQANWSWSIFCSVIAFIACMVVMITPLERRVGTTLLAPLPTSRWLATLGAWLPANFHWLPNTRDSFVSTNNLEFLFLVALAFVIYGLAALLLFRLPANANYRGIQRLIWAVTVVAGLLLVFAPAMLSHDLFVYADYGHTLVIYHANLYFVPPATISHDQITQLDDWRTSTAAYGPFWLYISALIAIVAGNHPLRYIMAFRLLGLAAHLANTWLVLRILRTSGRSPRIVTLGVLLYALNPLALLESCMGAHNDTIMVTFILLGILLSMRAEQRGFTYFTSYAPPAIAFTLAVLIKFTSIPLILFFLALLARKSILASPALALHHKSQVWQSALFKILLAGLLCAGLVLLFYTPFWLGHRLTAILLSFSAPPSAWLAENSILRAAQGWIHLHSLSARNSWMYRPLVLLSNHLTWTILNLIVLPCATLFGIVRLWHSPTPHTFTLAALVTFGALLLVTPWFFAWYVIWLVALAAVLLTRPGNPAQYALIAFALAFSICAFFSYVGNGSALLSNSGFQQCLRTFGIPVLVFLIVLLIEWRWLHQKGFFAE